MMINKRLINLCDKSKKYIGLTILSNWVAILCNIAIIFFIGEFINQLFKFKSGNMTYENVLFFNKLSLGTVTVLTLIILIVRFISNILYAKFSNEASAKARLTLREAIYKKLLRLGNKYSEVEDTSSIVQMSVEGVEQLEVYFGRYLPQFFYSLLVPVTLFIFMSFISVKAATVFILSVPLIPISIIAIMRIAKKILKDYWKSYSDLGGTFLENLQGLTTLKVFNIDNEKHVEMNREAEKFRKITMKVLRMQLNSITVMDLVAFGGAALGTIVALNEFKAGIISIGSLIVIILLSSEFFIPLRLLGSYFHIAMNGMAASERIFKVLDAVEAKDPEDNYTVKNPSVIKLENVEFSYDTERKILNNIDMSIEKGGITAIVGESGSGKSTVASLLLKVNTPNSGKLTIDDIDYENISKEDLYKNITLVSTNSYIFNGTIKENILMGNINASESEIEDALITARLKEFILSLPDGLETEVGQGGSNLSGGQRQRLALARAILSNREILVFDEATSNIDVESEEAIWEAIYDLSKSKTIVVISHRLANVKEAKEIYVMKKGEIVENGNHNQLIEAKGEYFNLVTSQKSLESVREV